MRLGWIAPDDKEEPALAIVMERLRQDGDGVLLIYDHAVDLPAVRPNLPDRGKAHVIITSNSPVWREVTANVIKIETWPKETGAGFLIVRSGCADDVDQARKLSEALGGLPLAHEMAAAYCETLGIPLVEYHRRFDAAPVQLLDDARHAPAAYESTTVAKTFTLAIEAAARRRAVAEPFIVYAALLAPEPIPLFLFAHAGEEFGEPLASELAGAGLDETVATLRTFALVDREFIVDERDTSITTDAIRLHRLVRDVAAARRQGEALEHTTRVLVRALGIFGPAWDNPRTWPQARRLTPHALAMVLSDPLPKGAEQIAGSLLTRLGSFTQIALGDFAQARALLERALAIDERMVGPEHPDTAATLASLSRVAEGQGLTTESRRLKERALAIREKVLGPDHPDTAASLGDLGQHLFGQRDLKTARSLLERALTICERTLGLEYPDVARHLHNLAYVLVEERDLQGARWLFERALNIIEKTFGPDQPESAGALDALAATYVLENQYLEASSLYERSLAITEKVFGPDHYRVAHALNNLANMYRCRGDRTEARPLFERALLINERVYGPEHADTARSLENLGILLKELGNPVAARPIEERALAIREKVLGSKHPDTADSLFNLACLLESQGDLIQAHRLFARAFLINESVFGLKHPYTKRAQGRLIATEFSLFWRRRGRIIKYMALFLFVAALIWLLWSLGRELLKYVPIILSIVTFLGAVGSFAFAGFCIQRSRLIFMRQASEDGRIEVIAILADFFGVDISSLTFEQKEATILSTLRLRTWYSFLLGLFLAFATFFFNWIARSVWS